MVLPISQPVRDEDESGQHAADEPTAMWDEDALAKLGLNKPAPDTKPKAGPGLAVSVETSPHATSTATAPKAKSPVMSWVITIGLALVLGVGVYFAVRALR